MSSGPHRNSTSGRKRRFGGGPSIDEFHQILQKLSQGCTSSKKTMSFSKSAVLGLREVYHSYLQEVAASLAHWDDLKDQSKVVAALVAPDRGCRDDEKVLAAVVEEAQSFLAAKSKKDNLKEDKNDDGGGKPKAKPRRKKAKITPEMEAEQERLLQQAKQKMQEKDS